MSLFRSRDLFCSVKDFAEMKDGPLKRRLVPNGVSVDGEVHYFSVDGTLHMFRVHDKSVWTYDDNPGADGRYYPRRIR